MKSDTSLGMLTVCCTGETGMVKWNLYEENTYTELSFLSFPKSTLRKVRLAICIRKNEFYYSLIHWRKLLTCSPKCQWCTSIHLLHILAPRALLSLSVGGAIAPPAPPYFAPMLL